MNASSDNEENNDEDAPETPYVGENMNTYSNNEVNNDEVAPDPPTNEEIINANDGEVTPDIPTNGLNTETIDKEK